jgi:hypothetical protein
MLAAMVNISEEKKSVLLVVIEKENFERMQQADPITLESIPEGGILTPPLFPFDFSVLIAYEENQKELYEKAREGGSKFLGWLERNRRFDPSVDGVDKVSVIKLKEEG